MHAHINFKFYNECNHINTNTLENIIIYHLMILYRYLQQSVFISVII